MVIFVVKRYAVHEAKKWRYAVRKSKIGRYAVRKGGVTLNHVVLFRKGYHNDMHVHVANMPYLSFAKHSLQYIFIALF